MENVTAKEAVFTWPDGPASWSQRRAAAPATDRACAPSVTAKGRLRILDGLADIHSANAEPGAARPSAIQSRGMPVACRPCLNQETGAPWKNHGQYVRCVAHAVNELRAAGLLMDEEGDHLVSGVP